MIDTVAVKRKAKCDHTIRVIEGMDTWNVEHDGKKLKVSLEVSDCAKCHRTGEFEGKKCVECKGTGAGEGVPPVTAIVEWIRGLHE